MTQFYSWRIRQLVNCRVNCVNYFFSSGIVAVIACETNNDKDGGSGGGTIKLFRVGVEDGGGGSLKLLNNGGGDGGGGGC